MLQPTPLLVCSLKHSNETGNGFLERAFISTVKSTVRLDPESAMTYVATAKRRSGHVGQNQSGIFVEWVINYFQSILMCKKTSEWCRTSVYTTKRKLQCWISFESRGIREPMKEIAKIALRSLGFLIGLLNGIDILA